MVCAAAGMSGVLRVTGDPGGAIHLADGRVTAIETPGAPSPEVLLLRSHRVTESGWDAAFAAAAASGDRMSAELTRRELVGSGELEGLLRTALADALFVLASGTIEDYRAEPGPTDRVLPLEPGAEPDRLLAEASAVSRCSPWCLPGMTATGSWPRRGRRGRASGSVTARTRSWPWPTGAGPPATWPSPWAAASTRRCCSWPGCSGAGEVPSRARPGRAEPDRPAPGDELPTASGLPRRQRDERALPARPVRPRRAARGPLGGPPGPARAARPASAAVQPRRGLGGMAGSRTDLWRGDR